MTSKVFRGLMLFFLTLYFSLVSLLGARLEHLRTRIFQSNHIYKVIVHAEGKVQAPKRLEKTLSLHFRFIPSTEISKIIKNKNKSKKQQTLGKKETLISRVPILLVSKVQFSTKNHRTYKETVKYGPLKRKREINRKCP